MAKPSVTKNVALVNTICGHPGGEFTRITLSEVVAIKNCETQITFVMRSGYVAAAKNDAASIAAEEAWCKLMGVE